MSESRDVPILALTGSGVTAVSRAMRLIQGVVLAVSIAAAIPTAHNLYISWKDGIPFSQVSHRLTQYELWMKNLECRVDYRQLTTAAGTKVDVGACQRSGDISIKVSTDKGQAAYEWIAFEQLQKSAVTRAASLMDLLIASAHAEEAHAVPGTAAAPGATVAPRPAGAFQVAQAGMEVMCQKRAGDKIVRIVKEGAKCYRETFSPLKGAVESRQEVACSAQC